MNNFWQNLKESKKGEPILVLAPMADVTDAAFRQIINKYGKPDVFWTEFVSADGLVLAPDNNPDENGITSQDKLRADLKFTPEEKPIVAQLFSSNPAHIKEVAKLISDLDFDGFDINMGCPDRSIEKQGCGSAMIKNFDKAKEIILAAKEGAPNLPVSVKTRLGYNKDILEEWLPVLLSVEPAVVTLHARTRKEMSKVPAKWDRIKRAVEIRNELGSQTLIFGNGDVTSLDEAKQLAKETGCDGIMIGRGIFGNPWFFSGRKPDLKEKLQVMIEHTKLFEELLPHKNFAIMKKHYKAYVEGFDGAKELRLKLMETEKAEEVEKIVVDFLKGIK